MCCGREEKANIGLPKALTPDDVEAYWREQAREPIRLINENLGSGVTQWFYYIEEGDPTKWTHKNGRERIFPIIKKHFEDAGWKVGLGTRYPDIWMITFYPKEKEVPVSELENFISFDEKTNIVEGRFKMPLSQFAFAVQDMSDAAMRQINETVREKISLPIEEQETDLLSVNLSKIPRWKLELNRLILWIRRGMS